MNTKKMYCVHPYKNIVEYQLVNMDSHVVTPMNGFFDHKTEAVVFLKTRLISKAKMLKIQLDELEQRLMEIKTG